jgi:hypothetical protein
MFRLLLGAITRMAAGKRRGAREEGKRRSPPSAQEHTQVEPIGSNVHFSFSPFSIGGRNRVGGIHTSEAKRGWRNVPGTDASLPTLRGERAPSRSGYVAESM